MNWTANQPVRARRIINAWPLPLWGWLFVCALTVGNFNTEIVPTPVDGNSLNQLLVTSLFFGIGAYGFTRHFGLFLKEKAALALFLLCFLSLASTAWSDVPSQSVLKGTSFLAGLFAVLVFVSRLSGAELLLGIFWGTTISLALSIAAAVMYPDIAQHDVVVANADAWRGIFPQKNVLGRGAMIVFCSGFTLLASASTRRWVYLAPMSAAGYLLVMSESSTSIVGCAAFAVAYPALALLMRTRGYKAVILTVLLAMASVILLASLSYIVDSVTSLFGKDLTFTGRSFLWVNLLEDYLKQPFLGYGTGAYFSERRVSQFDLQLGWDADNAHNGLIELALELGAVGLGLFLLTFWLVSSRVRRVASHDSGLLQLFLFLVPVLVLQNLMESTLMRPTNIIWLAFVALALKAALDMRALRRKA